MVYMDCLQQAEAQRVQQEQAEEQRVQQEQAEEQEQDFPRQSWRESKTHGQQPEE